MKNLLTILACIIVLGAAAAKADRGRQDEDHASEQGMEHGRGHGRGHGHGKKKHGRAHGRKGKKGLPPGLAKRWKSGDTLPPEADQEMKPVPVELEAKYEPVAKGRIRVVIGADVLVMDKETRKVVNVIRDVIKLADDVSK